MESSAEFFSVLFPSFSSYQALQSKVEARGRQPLARLGGEACSRHQPQVEPPWTRQDQQSGNFSPFSSRQEEEEEEAVLDKTRTRRTRTERSIRLSAINYQLPAR